MRTMQLTVFILGVVSFFGAAFFVGDDTGDVLWRMGVGLLLIDLALMKLYPSGKG